MKSCSGYSSDGSKHYYNGWLAAVSKVAGFKAIVGFCTFISVHINIIIGKTIITGSQGGSIHQWHFLICKGCQIVDVVFANVVFSGIH